MQQGRNMIHCVGSAFNCTLKSINKAKQVQFKRTNSIRIIKNPNVVMMTYDSGADGTYISKKDRAKAGLPILRQSSKKVQVANGEIVKAKNITTLPFPQLSARARQAHTFEQFPHSLMSVGQTSDDGTISIFTKDGVTVHKEEDVLITCKGEPILIGKRDEHGRY
jgi:NACalpha-BTF3-like transcription factor